MNQDSRWQVDDRPAPRGVDGRPLTDRGRSTRRGLLEAAESVFAERGYHDASIVKITETAGVAQGTFYNYFASKREIFDELVRDLNHRVRRAMSEGAAAGTTRAERERLGFKGFFSFTAEHPALYRVIREAALVSQPVLHEHYEKIATGYIEGLQAAMDDGEIVQADPRVLAWVLMGVGEIVGMRWILWDDEQAPRGVPDEVFEEMYRFILRGLGAGGDAR